MAMEGREILGFFVFLFAADAASGCLLRAVRVRNQLARKGYAVGTFANPNETGMKNLLCNSATDSTTCQTCVDAAATSAGGSIPNFTSLGSNTAAERTLQDTWLTAIGACLTADGGTTSACASQFTASRGSFFSNRLLSALECLNGVV